MTDFDKWLKECDAEYIGVLCASIAQQTMLQNRYRDNKEIKDNAMLIIYMCKLEIKKIEEEHYV